MGKYHFFGTIIKNPVSGRATVKGKMLHFLFTLTSSFDHILVHCAPPPLLYEQNCKIVFNDLGYHFQYHQRSLPLVATTYKTSIKWVNLVWILSNMGPAFDLHILKVNLSGKLSSRKFEHGNIGLYNNNNIYVKATKSLRSVWKSLITYSLYWRKHRLCAHLVTVGVSITNNSLGYDTI